MALILCIETSTEICSVAIALNGNILSLQEIEEGNAHASKLHVLVQQVLIDCGFVLKQVNAVAVSKGPGSYTGLRVGVSAAKGYCYALAIPLIAIDSLSCLGSKYLINNNISTNQLLVPMIDV